MYDEAFTVQAQAVILLALGSLIRLAYLSLIVLKDMFKNLYSYSDFT